MKMFEIDTVTYDVTNLREMRKEFVDGDNDIRMLIIVDYLSEMNFITIRDRGYSYDVFDIESVLENDECLRFIAGNKDDVLSYFNGIVTLYKEVNILTSYKQYTRK